MATKTLYYDIQVRNHSIKSNAGGLLNDRCASSSIWKACGYMQVSMQVSFGPYTLTSCHAKRLAGAFLAFMEGNVDDCNGESDQSDCHDKQSL